MKYSQDSNVFKGMKKWTIFSILACALLACVKNNPDPTFVTISEWTLLKNPELTGDGEGALSHNFSDAWVYIDNDLIGVFELPITIPVLKTGDLEIKVFPTIKNNGISATKKIYPYVDFYRVTETFEEGGKIQVDPETQYVTTTTFWIEDFESADPLIEEESTSLTSIIKSNNAEHLKYGNFYGEVSLNSVDSSWKATLINDFVIPRTSQTYLEIDYKSTNSLLTGVIELSSQLVKTHVNVQINPQEPEDAEWKKIYIDLTEIIKNTAQAEYYKMSFIAYFDGGADPTKLIVDNIKIIHN